LDNVTLDGANIDGFLQATAVFSVQADSAINTIGDIEIENAGEYEGELSFTFSDDGSFTLTSTSTRITAPDGDDWFVEFDTLAIDPARFGSFTPEDGTLTFRDDSLVPITVRFTQRSAEDNIVQVTVRNGSAENFDISR
jgi:hypothetical protein